MSAGIARWRSIPPLQWILSLVYTTILFLDSLVFGLVIVLLGWLPFRMRYGLARAWAYTNIGLARFLCGIDWVVVGREHIPREGAHVTMWKHTSAWETMAQMIVFPPQAWVLKREILWIPLVGWATWLMKCIAIDRGSGHRAVNQVLDQGRDRLAAGIWVLIFPEGTRTVTPPVNEFKAGYGLIAKKAGAPIQTVFIDTNCRFLGKGWPLFKLPEFPLIYRVELGKRFEAQDDVKGLIAGMEEYYRQHPSIQNLFRENRPQP
jgi:1-acyl-sn-glycerol-3-phosphate acyltransferase